MTLMSFLSAACGALCGLMLWLVIAEFSRKRLAVGAAVGMAILVGSVWALSKLLETYPTSVETESLSETFITFAIVGYLFFPIRLITQTARRSTQAGNGKQTATFRDYCAWLTLAFALGLLLFGGIGVPASLMRYGGQGVLTLLALVAGITGGMAASRRFNQSKPLAYPSHHYVHSGFPLPFMGAWTFVLLFATAAMTYLFY